MVGLSLKAIQVALVVAYILVVIAILIATLIPCCIGASLVLFNRVTSDHAIKCINWCERTVLSMGKNEKDR